MDPFDGLDIIMSWLSELGYHETSIEMYYPEKPRTFIRESRESVIICVTPKERSRLIYVTPYSGEFEVRAGYTNSPTSTDMVVNFYDSECFNQIREEIGI